jgi:peptidoglycan/xylan/chitin deacetylase (PgdA/CDA1 family)
MIRNLEKQDQEEKNPVKTTHEVGSCPCVAFRLDDVQDLYHNDVQMAIIDMFREENAKLTIGIICNTFGKDSALLDHIKNANGDKENSIIRVANHGWNHEDMTKLKKDEQIQLIRRSNQKILKTLGISPSVFIPPYNLFNSDTIDALRENNMSYVSSSLKYDPPSNRSRNSIPYRFPMTVTTSYVFLNKFWYGIANEKIMAKIRWSIGKYGYAIILMHPQQYIPTKVSIYKPEIAKQKALEKLRALIHCIRSIGIRIISIEEMNQHV